MCSGPGSIGPMTWADPASSITNTSRPSARLSMRWATIALSKPPMRSNQYQKNDPMPMWVSSNHIWPSVTTSSPAISWSRITLRVAST
jgi:hypothetical protein